MAAHPLVLPIPGTDVGCLIEEPEQFGDLTELLHTRGAVLFRGLDKLTPGEGCDFVKAHFRGLPEHLPPTDAKMGVEGQVTAMGNTRNAATGERDADFVPATLHGAPLLNPTDAEIEASLCEIEGEGPTKERKQCTYMEWHTDGVFMKSPPTYNALFCRKPGGSATGFADASLGLKRLSPEMRAIAERAVCHYKPGRPLQKLPLQKGAVPLEDESAVFSRGMVQLHPRTGEKVFRIHMRTLHTA